MKARGPRFDLNSLQHELDSGHDVTAFQLTPEYALRQEVSWPEEGSCGCGCGWKEDETGTRPVRQGSSGRGIGPSGLSGPAGLSRLSRSGRIRPAGPRTGLSALRVPPPAAARDLQAHRSLPPSSSYISLFMRSPDYGTLHIRFYLYTLFNEHR